MAGSACLLWVFKNPNCPPEASLRRYVVCGERALWYNNPRKTSSHNSDLPAFPLAFLNYFFTIPLWLLQWSLL